MKNRFLLFILLGLLLAQWMYAANGGVGSFGSFILSPAGDERSNENKNLFLIDIGPEFYIPYKITNSWLFSLQYLPAFSFSGLTLSHDLRMGIRYAKSIYNGFYIELQPRYFLGNNKIGFLKTNAVVTDEYVQKSIGGLLNFGGIYEFAKDWNFDFCVGAGAAYMDYKLLQTTVTIASFLTLKDVVQSGAFVEILWYAHIRFVY